jgi:carbamoyltransferase
VLSNWLGEKLDLRKAIRAELPGLRPDCEILFTEHHQSHAASAFYPSPFDEATILTIDGVGEWATTTIGHGCGSEIKILKELRFPYSLGLVYSAFTDHCASASIPANTSLWASHRMANRNMPMSSAAN